jgi:hypothetical protein
VLNHGASNVTTVEYNVPSCQHPRLHTLSYSAFAAPPPPPPHCGVKGAAATDDDGATADAGAGGASAPHGRADDDGGGGGGESFTRLYWVAVPEAFRARRVNRRRRRRRRPRWAAVRRAGDVLERGARRAGAVRRGARARRGH